MNAQRKIGSCLKAVICGMAAATASVFNALPLAAAELSSESYLSDALFAQWDAVDNTIVDGQRRHSGEVTKWTELVSGAEIPATTGSLTFNEKSVTFDGSRYMKTNLNGVKEKILADRAFTVQMFLRPVSKPSDTSSPFCFQTGTFNSIFGVRYNQSDSTHTFSAMLRNGAPVNIGSANDYWGKDVLLTAVVDGNQTILYLDGAAEPFYSTVMSESDSASTAEILLNPSTAAANRATDTVVFGYYATKAMMKMDVYSIRMYTKVLTAEERIGNYNIDRVRFLGLRPIANPVTVGEIADAEFTGLDIVPELSVQDAVTGKVLEEDVDYSVALSDNLLPGVAKAVVSFSGNYEGLDPVERTFNIVIPADREIALRGDFSPKPYDPVNPQTVPNLQILDMTTELPVDDPDAYEVRYANNDVPGKAYVIAQEKAGSAVSVRMFRVQRQKDFDSTDYDDEDLFAQWDAVDNTIVDGRRRHSGEVTKWTELVSGAEIPATTGSLTFNEKSVSFDGSRYMQARLSGVKEKILRDRAFTVQMFVRLGAKPTDTSSPFCFHTTTFNPIFGVRYTQGSANTFSALLRNAAPQNIDAANDYWGRDVLLTAVVDGDRTILYLDGAVEPLFSVTGEARTAEDLLNPSSANPAVDDVIFGYYATKAMMKMDVYSIRMYTKVLTRDERTRNYQIDLSRFIGNGFAVEDVPDQYFVAGTPCQPEAVVYNRATGRAMQRGTDYTLSYADNDEPGLARMIVAGVAGTESEGWTNVVNFCIKGRYHVKPNVLEEGDGLTWASPVSLTNALAQTAEGGEVFLQAGVYSLEVPVGLSTRMTILGGYKGGEKDDELDETSPESVFDCQETADEAFNMTTRYAGAFTRFERCVFTRGKIRGFLKTGSGSVRFVKCRFANNVMQGTGEEHGRGGSFSGEAGSQLAFEDCEFSGNGGLRIRGYGYGAYVYNFARATFDGCLFITNGLDWAASANDATHVAGSGLWAEYAPVVLRNCRFVANRIPASDGSGACVLLRHGCGGSAMTNCAFVANSDFRCADTWNPVNRTGAVAVIMDRHDEALDVKNCTFAYNIGDSKFGSGGLTVLCGSVHVADSIFWGNLVSQPDADNPNAADIKVLQMADYPEGLSSIATVEWTRFSGSGSAYVSSQEPSALTTNNCSYGDPKLVSPLSLLTNSLANDILFAPPRAEASAVNKLYFDRSLAMRDFLTGLDVHLRRGSKAIDAGNPEAEWANEPKPNGRRVNQGAYGNTSEAHVSHSGLILYLK